LFSEQKFRVFNHSGTARVDQNRSGSIVWKPGVAGEMSGVSQSDVLFTINDFQASW